MLYWVAIVLSLLGAGVTGYLTLIFWRDPEAGMAETTHDLEQLPQVMTDRYVAMTALAIGATLYGQMGVIAYLFAVFAFMGFADAVIYYRAGKPVLKHALAGGAAILVTLVAFFAMTPKGAV